MTNLRERIIADVKSCKTTLSREEDVKNVLNYATRANGDVGNEEYAEKDYQDALNVGEYLLKQDYASEIKVTLETVDEWVLLSIGIKDRLIVAKNQQDYDENEEYYEQNLIIT